MIWLSDLAEVRKVTDGVETEVSRPSCYERSRVKLFGVQN